MKRTLLKNLKATLAIAVSLAIGVSFMPTFAATSYASSFSTKNAVTGLTITSPNPSTLSLSWNSYAGADGYEVYGKLKGADKFLHSTTVTSTSCKRVGLRAGTEYCYKVRAYHKNSKGKIKRSKFSSVVTVSTRAFNTSGSVTGLKVASYNKSSVTLQWSPYEFAAGYEIYKSRSKNGSYVKLTTTKGTSYKRTGLTTNLTCYYKVRAYYKNTNGTCSYSRFSSVIAATPIKFTEGKIGGFKRSKRTYKSVSFVWNSYPEATGYEIYKATSKKGEYVKLATTKRTSYKRTGLTTNLTCYYKVRAYKKSNGKTIYTKFTAPVKGTPKLSKPSVSVISSKTGVTVKWGKVKGAKGYEVYRAQSINGPYSKIISTSSLSVKDTSLEKNKSYYFKVRAYRTINGSKKYSKFSKPQLGIKARLARVKEVTAVSKDSCVSLGWKSVKRATGYQVYRKTGTDGKYSRVGSTTSTSFNDYNVANGVTYHYKVRAYRSISGVYVYGKFSKVGYSRSAVVSTAVAWLGCKESNKSNKPIIDLYNDNMGTNFNYRTPWCAIFVSAVAIKSGTTSIIVRGSYCPSVINVYKKSETNNYSYGGGSKYEPKAGDVIFFDWNRNGVPDHTGLVASVSGDTVKTIEGNYSDAVGYRTFSVGYRYVQGYGLPNYDEANGIVFTGKSRASVGCGELSAMGIGTEPEGIEDLGSEYDFVEQNVEDNIGEAEDVSDYDKMVYMVSKVRSSADTEDIDCSESQYYAAFVYELCKEEGMDASIMTVEDEEGTTNAWVEVSLDDEWYTVDASKETEQITEFVPESTDVEGITVTPEDVTE